eukprot:scaffold35161_cov64-Phaeocystis_antarctica.AAC.5
MLTCFSSIAEANSGAAQTEQLRPPLASRAASASAHCPVAQVDGRAVSSRSAMSTADFPLARRKTKSPRRSSGVASTTAASCVQRGRFVATHKLLQT